MMMIICHLLLASILSTGQSWVLTSTHTNVIPRLTDDVTLNCFNDNPDDVSQTMDEITRIRLLKMDDDQAWIEYAEIMLPSTSLVKLATPNVPDRLAFGHLGSLNESYLSVTWSTSSEDTVGSYRCEVDGFALDNGNDVHATTGTVNLTQDDVTMKELLDLMVQMRKRSDQLSSIMKMHEEDSLAHHQNLTAHLKSQIHSDIVKNYFELRHWPAGNFSLLSTDDGCPDTPSSKFESGFSRFETVTSQLPRHNFTAADNLKGVVFERCGSRNVLKFEFCAAEIREPRMLWPPGTYCIAYTGKKCPTGFQNAYTAFYLEISDKIIGKWSFRSMDSGSDHIYFWTCCRNDGPHESPILLPNTKSFYLYRYKGRCQTVQGTEVKEQMFTLETDRNKKNFYGSNFYADITLTGTVHLCYYFQKNFGTFKLKTSDN